MKKLLLIILLFYYLPSYALQNKFAGNNLVGTWKLVSITGMSAKGIEIHDYGLHPQGYLHYTPDGHVIVIIVKSDRLKPVNKKISSAESAYLINSMTSYAGTYSIHGNQVVHHIEVSWNQAWTGTNQKRFYQLKDNYLVLTIPSFIDADLGKMQVNLMWEKVSPS